jgi:peptide/nickel transport system substrate-binding protein
MPNADSSLLADYSNKGPYVDMLRYQVIEGDDQQVLALINDQIDMIGDAVDPVYLPQLDAASNIMTTGILRNGYGQLIINCNQYPYNLTAFRRAFAFAIDKVAISDDIWDGEALPLDSPVAAVNPWTIEGLMPYTYYTNQSDIGNQILDDAGFLDIDADGWREAPDGSEIDVTIEVAVSSTLSIEIGSEAETALHSLKIDATSSPTDFFDYITRVNLHGAYDMVFLGKSFSSFDLNWLETEFSSSYASVDYFNPSNFRNATFDSWIPQLLYSTEYEDVYEAAIEMQRILLTECPVVVCYENMKYSAFRTDRFEEHVLDASEGIPSFWTNLNGRLKASQGGPFGGTMRISNYMDIDSFNFMVSSSAYTRNVLKNLESSLLKRNPDGVFTSWLAESFLVETHVTNAAVPIGHTRFTFDLIENATWSDGNPLTAQDVAFSIIYYKDGVAYGNPTGVGLSDVVAAYASEPYQAVVEFSSESYWHLSKIALLNILPQHVFEVIGIDGWSTWNPVQSSDPYVTCAPFELLNWVPGEFVELNYRDDFFYGVTHISGEVDTTPPGISGPLMVMFPEGETGHTITWTLTDDHPGTYEIFLNESLGGGIWDWSRIQEGLWNSTPKSLVISLDGLSAGIHQFVILAFDESGNDASNSVLVYVLDMTPPEVSHPEDIDFNNGTLGNYVNWTASDDNPFSYAISVNGTLVDGGWWNSSSEFFIYNLDYLAPGSYNVSIIVFDAGLNMATDEVWVSVKEINPFFQSLMDNLVLIGAAGALVLVIIVVIIIRSRR